MERMRKIIILVLILAFVFSQTGISFAASASLKTPAIKTIAYDENDKDVDLTWSKVSGAKGYQIYRATSKNGTYKKIAAVSGKTTYSDDSVIENKTYYYKVRAYKKVSGKTKYSSYSSIKSVKIWAESLSLDLIEQLEIASAEHKEEQLRDVDFSSFTEYLVSGKEYQGLLTQEEINTLRNVYNTGKKTLTYSEAAEEVELYFRAVKYAYGGYFYFGGDEAFGQAEKEVMDQLKEYETIGRLKLRDMICEALDFVIDGHFGIDGNRPVASENVTHEYYYSNIYFSKDANGYYKEFKGTKWYYQSCTDNRMKIETSLTNDGKIKYSAVLFCPPAQTDLKDTITLKSGDKKVSLKVFWNEKTIERYTNRSQAFVFEEVDGVSYISIESFEKSLNQDTYKAYIETGKAIRDSKVVIYDLRGNGGGSSEYSSNWVKSLTGTTPIINGAHSNRLNALSTLENCNSAIGQEKYVYGNGIYKGTFLNNDVPVILLMNDQCGSAGESALMFARAVDNIIVIGSNSAGCMGGGNVSEYGLPYSGNTFYFGSSLSFSYGLENMDDTGIEPDIWCNPADALDAAYKLIVDAGYADEETIKQLKDQIEYNKPQRIAILRGMINAQPGRHFGSRDYDEVVTVSVDGKTITDCKIYFDDPSCGSITYNPDGSFRLKSLKRGNWTIFIEYKGRKYEFFWDTL